jgi:hypothetical protein
MRPSSARQIAAIAELCGDDAHVHFEIVSSSVATSALPMTLVLILRDGFAGLDADSDLAVQQYPVVGIRTALVEFYASRRSGTREPLTIGSREDLKNGGWIFVGTDEQIHPIVLREHKLSIFTGCASARAWAVCLQADIAHTIAELRMTLTRAA